MAFRIVDALILICCLSAPVTAVAAPTAITVDSSRVTGTIKPLQDLGLGPLNFRGEIDTSQYFKDLAVRNVRLHDAPWTFQDDVQDINYVFPDPKADPAKDESYNFALTDYYINSITSLGINVIYRLGYSGDFFRPRAMRWIDPPKSYDKWAAVSAHIARHYFQGAPAGSGLKIKYWEVWNEPDGSDFWSGTPAQYYHLYEVVAPKLKAIDPSLKVGGPALASKLEFLEGWLKYCRDRHLPVDFVSWHIYTAKPEEVLKRALRVHELMVQYGFGSAESVLDEWNYDITALFSNYDQHAAIPAPFDPKNIQSTYDTTRGEIGAAFDASVLIVLQDAHVDIATFYTGTTLVDLGLFTPFGGPTKAYHAFLAFRRLLDTPQRLAIEGATSTDVTALAGIAKDRKEVAVLVTYLGNGKADFSLRFRNLPWPSASYALQTIDRATDLATIKAERIKNNDAVPIAVDGPTVLLVTLKPDQG